MKFISGFLIGILAGMFCILGPIVAFLGGIAVGWKVWGDDSDETPSKPTYPTYDSPGKPGTVNYQGMSTSAEKEPTA